MFYVQKMHRAAGATLTQTDARSISTIGAEANGRTRVFSAFEMRRPARDALKIK
jgi:hypothetical protein